MMNGDNGVKLFGGATAKTLAAILIFIGGWVMSQTRDSATVNAQITQANSSIVAMTARVETKVSKDEFAQYTSQMMVNQQRIESELAAIRAAQIAAAEETRTYRQRGH